MRKKLSEIREALFTGCKKLGKTRRTRRTFGVMVMATLTQRQAAYHICLDMGSSADGDSAVGNIICATQTK